MAAYKKITLPHSVFSTGNIQLQLDVTNLNGMLQKADKNVLSTAENDEIMMDMAEHVIYSALEANLIPYKQLYQIRSKRGKKLRDENGKPVRYKSGNRIGEFRYEPFTPAQYFYYGHENIATALTKDDTRSKFVDNFVSNDVTVGGKKATKHKYTVYDEHGNKKQKSVLAKVEEKVIHGNRGQDVVTHGSGEHTYGSTTKRKRKRVYWTDVGEGKPEYNRSYTEILESHKISKKGSKNYGKEYSRKKYYSDRPPHLQDITDPRNDKKSSHVVTVVKHQARIRIQSKKPKDTRFVDQGGEQYAYIQYYTPDKNWKRISTYTEEGAVKNKTASGRWLELAIGLPIPSGYKRKSIGSVGKENYKDMVQLLKDELDRKNGKL